MNQHRRIVSLILSALVHPVEERTKQSISWNTYHRGHFRDQIQVEIVTASDGMYLVTVSIGMKMFRRSMRFIYRENGDAVSVFHYDDVEFSMPITTILATMNNDDDRAWMRAAIWLKQVATEHLPENATKQLDQLSSVLPDYVLKEEGLSRHQNEQEAHDLLTSPIGQYD